MRLPPSPSPLHSPVGSAFQRTRRTWRTLGLKMCAQVGPLFQWSADGTAQTFSVEESARWRRAAPSRHHALQAPTDRLPTATLCTLYPLGALCSLLWVSITLGTAPRFRLHRVFSIMAIRWLRKLGQCRPLWRTRYLTHHARVHRRAVPKTTGRSYIFAHTRCRCVIWLSSSQIAAFTHFRSTHCIFFQMMMLMLVNDHKY